VLGDVRALLGDRIPADHAGRVAAEHWIARFYAARRGGSGAPGSPTS
jgi:hypothetical protein